MMADVVVLVGTKLDASVTMGGPPLFAGTEKLIQIDIEPTNIGLNRMPDVAIQGDARVVLEQLAEAWDGKPKDAWLAQAKEGGGQLRAAWEAQTAPLEGSPVPPGRMIHEVMTQAGREAILISDGGDIHTWAITRFPAYRPGSLLATHDALGTIGVGVPYALGAKAAAPDRDVVLCIGDGSFGFGAMELETASRYGLRTVSDLRPMAPRLSFGGPPECRARLADRDGHGSDQPLKTGLNQRDGFDDAKGNHGESAD